MSAMSDYLEAKSLDHCLGIASFPVPGATYVALFTTDPTDAGTGTEVPTTSGYARQVCTWTRTDNSASNSVALNFGPATTAYGEVGWFGVYDAETDGNLLYHGQVTTPKTVAVGDLGTFLVGELVIRHQ